MHLESTQFGHAKEGSWVAVIGVVLLAVITVACLWRLKRKPEE